MFMMVDQIDPYDPLYTIYIHIIQHYTLSKIYTTFLYTFYNVQFYTLTTLHSTCIYTKYKEKSYVTGKSIGGNGTDIDDILL